MTVKELRKLLQGISPEAVISVRISDNPQSYKIIGVVHQNDIDGTQATPTIEISITEGHHAKREKEKGNV